MSSAELKSNNDLIKSLLETRFDSERERFEMTALDHNEIAYKITSGKGDKMVKINVMVPHYDLLVERCNAEEFLRGVYGEAFSGSAMEKYNVSLEVDSEKCKGGKDADGVLLDNYSSIGRYVSALPYLWAFKISSQKQGARALALTGKDGEVTYVLPLADRVIVCFGFNFKDESDRTIAKVFLTELINCRRSQSYSSALQLYYGNKPPAELGGIEKTKSGDEISYATFVFLPLSYSSEVKKERCANQMLIFRAYLRYHIKASNVMMHTRMRNRVNSFLKVLNRAKRDVPVVSKNIVRG